jgi:hypothetical protein
MGDDMRHLLFLILAISLFPSVGSSELPDLICQELRVVRVDPYTLQSREFESHTLYRFKSSKLFLSSPDRSEYLYNTVAEVEFMRFVSGHKTILFHGSKFDNATFIHANTDEVRVSEASCTRA